MAVGPGVRSRRRHDTCGIRLLPSDLRRRPTSLANLLPAGGWDSASTCAHTEMAGIGKLALLFIGIRWPVVLRTVREAIRRRLHPRQTAAAPPHRLEGWRR
jgi:hypothetical protein